MGQPKLQIIVLFQNLGEERAYYARSPAPPLSGILLAALTPPEVEVEVLHEMVRPIDYDTDADFIALSFMDFCAPHAYRVAARFRALGKTVIAGGRYPSTFPDAVLPHFDTVVAGEAEAVWPRVVADLLAGRLERLYRAPAAPSLEGIPTPRYDLVEPVFDVPVVLETSRGCPFRCSYCQLNIARQRFRTRPVEEVIRDLTATDGLPFHRRKMAMIYDNNFGGDMKYAKGLLRRIAELDLWALGTQFSFNCLYDDTFVDLLEAANTTMAFIGLESMNERSLVSVNKRHNRVAEYAEMLGKLRERGIMTFTGVMLALDEDTPEYYAGLPAKLEEVDPAAIFVSLSIPIPGTPFHAQAEAEGRIVDTDLAHYDGDHLVLEPKHVSREEALEAFRQVNRSFYAWSAIGRRWGRLVRSYLGGTASRERASRRDRGRDDSRPLPVELARRLVRTALLSFIFLKLSAFTRHRWREKIARTTAPEPAGRTARPADRAAGLSAPGCPAPGS